MVGSGNATVVADGNIAVKAPPTASPTSCTLTEQLSSHKCESGADFGCFVNNKTMWTENGCRGVYVHASIISLLFCWPLCPAHSTFQDAPCRSLTVAAIFAFMHLVLLMGFGGGSYAVPMCVVCLSQIIVRRG